MSSDQLDRYAKAIVAVGTGSASKYITAEIAECSSIIQLAVDNNVDGASKKIQDIFDRQNEARTKKKLSSEQSIVYTQEDLTEIVKKIRELTPTS